MFGYVVVGYCCIGWVDGGREGSNWCLGMWLLDIVVLVGEMVAEKEAIGVWVCGCWILLYWLGRWRQRRKQLVFGYVVVGYWFSSLVSPVRHSIYISLVDYLI